MELMLPGVKICDPHRYSQLIFYLSAKLIQGFSTNVAVAIGHLRGKKKLDLSHIPYIKINSKENFRKKQGGNLWNLVIGKEF